jgi:hypothetical protein
MNADPTGKEVGLEDERARNCQDKWNILKNMNKRKTQLGRQTKSLKTSPT